MHEALLLYAEPLALILLTTMANFGLRAAAVDDDLLDSLQRLMFADEPLTPADLPRIELALRALVMVEELHMVPKVAFNTRVKDTLDDDDRATPIGDGVLDYEFVYQPTEINLLSDLSADEVNAIEELVSATLAKQSPKPLRKLNLVELKEMFGGLPRRFVEHVSWLETDDLRKINEGVEDQPWTESGYVSQVVSDILDEMSAYAVTLVRLHAGGGIIFSDSKVARIAHEHIFSVYPLKLFDSLDTEWKEFVRTALGPGVGAFVPPLLACVLSRVRARHEISLAVRDLRAEYASSRRQLWEMLEELWYARSARKQFQIFSQLENASKNLFKSAFPERFPYLETAWNTSVEIGQLRPLSAAKEVGKAFLKHNEPAARVCAISFARQISADLRRVEGFADLLRKILRPSERARFGIK